MLDKHILPETFNFDVPPVEIIDCGRKGLDKTAMVKRASAFEDVLESLVPLPNRTYLHVITTGASEFYGANRNCFVAGTKVMTPGGVVSIENLKPGDLVYTGKGRAMPVLRTMSRTYSGELITIKAQGVPEAVTMTADHRVLSMPNRLYMYHYARFRNNYIDKDELTANISEIRSSDSSFMPAGALTEKDWLVLPRLTVYPAYPTKFEKTNGHQKDLKLDTDDLTYAYVLGLWLAEGCVGQSGSKAYSVLTLNTKTDAASIERLKNFATAYNLSLSASKPKQSGSVRNFCIGGTLFARHLVDLFGKGAKNKRVPDVVYVKSRDWQLSFLAGYLDGDGCQNKSGKERGGVKCSSASLSLVYTLQTLLASLSIKASIAKCCNRRANGCFGKTDNVIYQLSVSASELRDLLKYSTRLALSGLSFGVNQAKNLLNEGELLVKITKLKKEVTTGTRVYDIEVAEDHSFCVPFVVHNCDAYNEKSYDLVFPFPEDSGHTHEVLDGGLSKYHDSTYMSGAHVYQEHKTKDTDPSGEVVAAKYNDDMHRGELIIAVDNEKWAPRLQRKSQGKDIFLSIGAELPRDICLVCGRVAHTFGEHCDHFKKMRGVIMDDGTPCCVMNDSPKFYDISGVDVPADRIAFVLRKVASGAQVKQASAEALFTYGSRRPLPAIKTAALLSKLSAMEKKIEGMVMDGQLEEDTDSEDEEKARKAFILRVEPYPADEVIDGCSRRGILLSPGMLFNLIGKECAEGPGKEALLACDDGCCGDCSAALRELEEADPDERDGELVDGSFDQHFLPDLGLERILDEFMPMLGMDNQSAGTRVIRITINGTGRKAQRKEASFTTPAQQALRRTYARYLISFAAQNDDSTCRNALRKVAAYGK